MVRQGSYLEFETEICNAARFFEMQEFGDGGEEETMHGERERQRQRFIGQLSTTPPTATTNSQAMLLETSANSPAAGASSSPSTVTK
jgi:hypothetical protein